MATAQAPITAWDEHGNPVSSPAQAASPTAWDEHGNPIAHGGGASGSWTDAGAPNTDPYSTQSITSDPNQLTRALRYMGGEAGGLGSAAKGVVTGAAKMGKDLVQGGGIGPNPAFGQDVVGMGKGLWDTLKAPFKWETYTDPRQFGAEVFNLASTLYGGEKAPEIPGEVAARVKAFSPMEKLKIEGARRTAEGQMEARMAMQKGMAAKEAAVDAEATQIRDADARSQLPAIDLRPVRDSFIKRAGDLDAGILDRMPNAKAAEDILDQAKVHGGWEDLKQLRSAIGRRMMKSSGIERAIIQPAYDTATQMMKDRAEALGQSDVFKHYNDLHYSIQVQRAMTYDPLMDLDPSQFREFFTKLRDKTNVNVQDMLDEFNQYTNPQGLKGAGAGDVARRVSDDVKVFHDVLTKKGGDLMSRITAAIKHPLYGTLGGIAGMKALSMLPGGEWLGGMLGAGEGASIADKIALAKALTTGRQFPEGAAALATPEMGRAPAPLKPKGDTFENPSGYTPKPRTREEIQRAHDELPPEAKATKITPAIRSALVKEARQARPESAVERKAKMMSSGDKQDYQRALKAARMREYFEKKKGKPKQ